MAALAAVSEFISKVDASRQRKPSEPTAEHIETYCAQQQKKIDLLLAEAEIMKAGGEPPHKVKWTDIDGNVYNDAPWLDV